MPSDSLIVVNGLITYLGLIILLTFHEFAHAWTGMKCGGDVARLQGCVSLNPLVHIDPIGTVLLPLIMIFASPSIGRFPVGWAKPVPFNPTNLGNRKRDEILIAMAGPAMNFVLAFRPEIFRQRLKQNPFLFPRLLKTVCGGARANVPAGRTPTVCDICLQGVA